MKKFEENWIQPIFFKISATEDHNTAGKEIIVTVDGSLGRFDMQLRNLQFIHEKRSVNEISYQNQISSFMW